MDLQKRQAFDKNKTGFIGNTMIVACIIVESLLTAMGGMNSGAYIRLGASIVVLALNIAAFAKYKTSEKYMHICCQTISLLVIILLCTARQPHMFGFIFPLAILIMLFQKEKLTKLAAVVGFAETVIFEVALMMNGKAESGEVIIDCMLMLIMVTLAVIVSKMQVRHFEENIQAVENTAQEQEKTATGIVELAEQLNQKFVQAQEVSERLNESMDTSHSAVSEIADSTRMNAEAITQQTDQTSDIQQSIQSVGDEAKNMGEISERTNSTVAEGVELIGRLKEQASEVAKINVETKSTTENLNESIKAVQEITEAILGISSQTNLLALNASIEAARAGEAGKGFAVVADEIRNLSEDTRKATEQISEIINKLTKDAENASISMTKSADYAAKQNELIAETGNKLSDIKEDTDSLHQGVVQVNTSVESIINANTLIMDSITNLSATGEEVAASTDTALSLSDSSMTALKNMNSLLHEIHEISNTMQEVATK